MKVKILNKSNNPLPKYETKGAAGMDIRAAIKEPVVIHPFQRALIPTGLFMEIPEGWELQIRPRSGNALKFGVTVCNSPGTVDSDFRGEIGVILINLGLESFTVKSGDRVAQGVFARHERVEFIEVEELSKTERGDGAYGHTGAE